MSAVNYHTTSTTASRRQSVELYLFCCEMTFCCHCRATPCHCHWELSLTTTTKKKKINFTLHSSNTQRLARTHHQQGRDAGARARLLPSLLLHHRFVIVTSRHCCFCFCWYPVLLSSSTSFCRHHQLFTIVLHLVFLREQGRVWQNDDDDNIVKVITKVQQKRNESIIKGNKNKTKSSKVKWEKEEKIRRKSWKKKLNGWKKRWWCQRIL